MVTHFSQYAYMPQLKIILRMKDELLRLWGRPFYLKCRFYIKYSLYFEEMKSKSISFAEVLKKNAKSPRVEANSKGARLCELAQQFEDNPSADYTLYLGGFSISQKSKPAPFQMTFSRNQTENQQVMFDSWIQKQSAFGSNKENIRNQPQRVNYSQTAQRSEGGFKKLGLQSKAKEDSYPLASKSSQRQKESKAIEQSQSRTNFIDLNIEMIKSNGYENEQMTKVRSPRTEKIYQPNQINYPQTQTNYQSNQTNYQPTQANEDLRPKNIAFQRSNQQRTEPTFKEIKQVEQVRIQNNRSVEKHNDFIVFPRENSKESFSDSNIEEDISEITSKYINQKYESQAENEEEDEELLLAQSNDKADQICYTQTYAQQAEKNDHVLKKRLEDAKSLLGNYFDKIKKGKQEENEKEPQVHSIPSQQSNKNEDNRSNHLVGYSFSTNYLPNNQLNHNQQQHYINEVVSEVPDEVEEPLNDSSFRKKYLNLQSYQDVDSNHIKNIESIKYERQGAQEERLYDAPYDSFKAHLINSNDRSSFKYQECHNIQLIESTRREVERPKQLFVEVKQESPKVQQIEFQPQNTRVGGKNRQKISLISSKKSNKSSPTASAQPKSPQVPPTTTDFTVCEKISEKRDTLQSFKSIDRSVPIHESIEIENIQSKDFKSPSRIDAVSNQNKFNKFATLSKRTDEELNAYITPTYGQPTSIPTKMSTTEYHSSTSHNKFNSTYYATATEQPDAPTYSAKINLMGSKNFEYAPLKVETPYNTYSKVQVKKETSYAGNSFEHKYATPTYASEKDSKRNYLSKLDIKESITVEDAKPKPGSSINKQSFTNNYVSNYNNTVKEYKTTIISIGNTMKQSLKQSINVSSSEEFTFDL